ncbi:MAG: phosphoribosylamine--glycine ligase [Bryobacteraceae bacterium]|nr:phosphoribosylamine--glycine ligase [Bryobacteraceae bacterium]
MKVMVIGSGGREHAMVWKLSQSSLCSKVYAAPGNPGMAPAERIQPPRSDPESFLRIAQEREVDLTVVGPEAPLVDGVVDLFQARGRRIVGPTARAAQLEGSKVFAKRFMERAGVPTARFLVFDSAEEACQSAGAFGFPAVLKADGLAAGKGVIIAGDDREAAEALQRLPKGRVLVEECLTGEEVSFIAFCDGDTAIPFEPTQDHKRVFDDDRGPNTGGMGAYCDPRILSDEDRRRVMDRIIQPTLDQMRREGAPFTGFLYAGLMMTADGPKALEFNVRLGDPEAQPLMYRMKSDFLATLAEGAPMEWRPDPAVCVVLAAAGYPGTPRTGDPITGIDACGATVFHAGTRAGANGLVTGGGRVLGVTASGPDLPSAIANTYAAVEKIHFEGMHYRRDIGRKGLRRW